ncbi:MAG: 30S ribosomal protein S27e [Salinirussus sp.]
MPGNFIRVTCGECDAEQVVYEKAATPVECSECGASLVTPAGGKARIAGETVEVVGAR